MQYNPANLPDWRGKAKAEGKLGAKDRRTITKAEPLQCLGGCLLLQIWMKNTNIGTLCNMFILQGTDMNICW